MCVCCGLSAGTYDVCQLFTVGSSSKEAQHTWIYGSKLCQLVQSAAFSQALIQSSQLHFHLLVAGISHVHLHHPCLWPHNLHHAQHSYYTMCCSASLVELDMAEQRTPDAAARKGAPDKTIADCEQLGLNLASYIFCTVCASM